MSVGDTDITIANTSLAMISARKQITSFSQGTTESINVNIFYNRIRDQVMTMAPWNFVRRTELLSLLKAAPGTPENTASATPWDSSMPAPPWLYEYRYPNDCLFMRYVTYQPNAQVSTGSPPLTSAILSSDSWWPGPPQKFIIAQDFNVSATITAITKANPGVVSATNVFANGDRVTVSDITGMVQLNANTYFVSDRTAGSFTLTGLDGVKVDTSGFNTYTSGGFVRASPIKCLLTNIEFCVGVYNALVVDPAIWPAEFVNAFATALAGYLAFPISGKLDLKTQLLGEANAMIVEARRTDGNEGLTTQDHTPDWIRIRGVNYPQPWRTEWVAPWPSLFSVA